MRSSNAPAGANRARARLAREQAETALARLEMAVASEVRAAGRAVETNLKRAESTRTARVLQAQRLDAEEKKFAAGRSTNFFVTQAQRDLDLAAVNELRAIVAYQMSLVAYERFRRPASARAAARSPSERDEERSSGLLPPGRRPGGVAVTPGRESELAEVARELRRLRRTRGLSQMALALSAGVSSRHVSFVETGRARPGRDILLRLASALGLSDDEQKALLAAAGFEASQAPARAPSAPQLGPLLGPIRSILARLEPLPAVLLDARWDLLMPNAAYVRLSTMLSCSPPFPRGALEVTDRPRPNRLRELVDPRVRRAILNWNEVARAALSRAYLEAELSRDPALHALLHEVATEAVGLATVEARPEEPLFPIRVDVRLGSARIRLFSIVTAWATDRPGLRIEMLHPADQAALRALAKLAHCCPSETEATVNPRRLARVVRSSGRTGEGGTQHR